jgi:hypothetical protein
MAQGRVPERRRPLMGTGGVIVVAALYELSTQGTPAPVSR